MENRDSIVRKLNALKAKFDTGSNCSEAEAETAMRMYNTLMQKYNLTETDLSLKQSGIHFASISQKERKNVPPMAWITTPIAMLTDTKAIWGYKFSHVTFLGTQADIQYAEFLYRLIEKSLASSWIAYRYSYEYTDLNENKGVHGRKIRNAFEKGFLMRLTAKLEDMMKENKQSSSNSLVVLKQSLIVAAMEQLGMQTQSKTRVSRYTANEAMYAGGREADKVRLRQEAEQQEILRLEAR